jgi:hypothetical protein
LVILSGGIANSQPTYQSADDHLHHFWVPILQH